MSMTEAVTASVKVTGVPILLVEDDHGDAVLVQSCLSEAGVADESITWARTLGAALEALAGHPACVLLDLGLPDSVGSGAVNAMVQAAPGTAVIVLTGRSERGVVDALAAGAQDYLAKDTITGELLQRSIRYAIERKRAQAAQQQLREFALTAAEQERLERGLLPIPLLRTDAVACATYYQPGSEDAVLGGDFYDVVEIADGRVRAVIGDVMGHGPDEAALGVHLRVAWRTLVLAGTPDLQIMPTLALLLRAESGHAARFVTVCDVTIEAGEMTVRTAGHPAPIVCTGGAARYLELDVGTPLGLPGPHTDYWPENRLSIGAGSTVMLYSDGLLDAYFDERNDGLGIPELVAAVAECTRGGGQPGAWIPALLARAPRDSVDDKAVVVLTVDPSG